MRKDKTRRNASLLLNILYSDSFRYDLLITHFARLKYTTTLFKYLPRPTFLYGLFEMRSLFETIIRELNVRALSFFLDMALDSRLA